MKEVPFIIEGVVNCRLEFLTNPEDINRIENYQDVLRAVCTPYKKIGYDSSLNYLSEEQKNIIINQLRNIAEQYQVFYSHFEIDFSTHRIGPTIGSRGKNTVFWLRPTIEIKPQKYCNLNDRNQKSAQLYLQHRMANEGVPFMAHEDTHELLTNWNPLIEFSKGLMKCYSSNDSETIDKMVIDRIKSLIKG